MFNHVFLITIKTGQAPILIKNILIDALKGMERFQFILKYKRNNKFQLKEYLFRYSFKSFKA